MTEAEWLVEQKRVSWMLEQLKELNFPRRKAGQRKLRLFACGCVRGWEDLLDDQLRGLVEVAERFADGLVEKPDLASAYRVASSRWSEYDPEHLYLYPTSWRLQRVVSMTVAACLPKPFEAALMATSYPLYHTPIAEQTTADKLLCDLLRCVFGNPFRDPAFSRKWRTETVTALAVGIYEKRAFDRMPFLADALEDAGCDDPAMLTHLRGDNPHCRGCWVLDLAMGK